MSLDKIENARRDIEATADLLERAVKIIPPELALVERVLFKN